MNENLIGLYLIVRDASATIEPLLNCIAPKHTDAIFDEIVFVDTGSTDDTREKIARHFGQDKIAEQWGPHNLSATFEITRCDGRSARLQFASFEWCDDFAKARNYAFRLGSAKWRGYLDADDVWPGVERLRGVIERAEREAPEVNALSFGYQYTPEIMQDVIRFVRWGDGFRWEDEIHEHLVLDRGARKIVKIDDLPVIHAREDGAGERSLKRNIRICSEIRAKADKAADVRKVGLMDYYLGTYAKVLGENRTAESALLRAADALHGTNLGCYAHVERARMFIDENRIADAIEAGGQAIAAAPEFPDGWGALGVALSVRGWHSRAVRVFDALRALPQAILQSVQDRAFNLGAVNVWAARSYLAEGRLDDAGAALNRVPADLRTRDSVAQLYCDAHSALMKKRGIAALKAMVDYYVADTQATKALRLIYEAPAAIADTIEVAAMERDLKHMIRHLDGWDAYRKTYAEIPASDYHTDEKHAALVAHLGRTKHVWAWAESLPKDGPVVRVLCVGAQDCIIEMGLLERNPRIRIHVCDVAPEAARGIQAMRDRFPDRVDVYTMRVDHYDWYCDTESGTFDAAIMFEVLEHVPSDVTALSTLRRALLPGGRLFLSTPVADRWVEPYLADPARRPAFYGHVRAHNPGTLRDALVQANLRADVLATDRKSIFLVDAEKRPHGEIRFATRKLSILLPGNVPQPFDATDLTRGHVGGSEEAVIHLSHAIARSGRVRVTVYAPRPDRDPVMHVSENVLWRDHAEFDPDGDHGDVLVWRSPQYAALLADHIAKHARKPYRIHNWLHDTHYEAKAADYEKVETSFVLSKAHDETLQKFDGVRAFKLRRAANGIDAASFAKLDGLGRDQKRVIWAQSPDRGLLDLLYRWPRVRAEVPDATLVVYYDWAGLRRRAEHDQAARALLLSLEGQLDVLRDEGVTYHGGVSHPVLHEAYARAGVWAYPVNDFVEISCISAMKAQAAGCWPAVIGHGALQETVVGGVISPTIVFADGTRNRPAEMDRYVDHLIRLLKFPPTDEARVGMAKSARERFDWKLAAADFIDGLW